MKKIYDVFFKQNDGSYNHRILEGCLKDIVEYLEEEEKVQEILEIKLRENT